MRVTVIPEDKKIIVDSVALELAFTADPNIHAIQWYDTHGTVEYKVGAAQAITGIAIVQPFINTHEAEVARLNALAATPSPTPAP